jgi:hypothetical protein
MKSEDMAKRGFVRVEGVWISRALLFALERMSDEPQAQHESS